MYAYIIKSVLWLLYFLIILTYYFRCTFICSIRSVILHGIELLSSSRTFGALHTRVHISSFKHDSWLPISFFIIFETFYMEFFSGEFPGHFRTGVSLYSSHVLVLLELWHSVLCIMIYLFCMKTTHSQRIHISLYFTVITSDSIVVFNANRMWNVMLSVFRLLLYFQQVCKSWEF